MNTTAFSGVRPNMMPSWHMWNPPWMNARQHWSSGMTGIFEDRVVPGSIGAKSVGGMVDSVRANGWRMEEVKLVDRLASARSHLFDPSGQDSLNSFLWRAKDGIYVELGSVDDPIFSKTLRAMSRPEGEGSEALDESWAELIISAVDARGWRLTDMVSVVTFLEGNRGVFDAGARQRMADFLTVARHMKSMGPVPTKAPQPSRSAESGNRFLLAAIENLAQSAK